MYRFPAGGLRRNSRLPFPDSYRPVVLWGAGGADGQVSLSGTSGNSRRRYLRRGMGGRCGRCVSDFAIAVSPAAGWAAG